MHGLMITIVPWFFKELKGLRVETDADSDTLWF